MQIINLNSKISCPASIEKELREQYSGRGYPWNMLRKVPVFLVHEALIDQLYPPWKRKVFDEDRLRDRCESLFETSNQLENPLIQQETLDGMWEKLDECALKESYRYITAVGLYVQRLGTTEIEKILPRNSHLEFYIGSPVIFICPERVDSWSGKVHSLMYGPIERFRLVFLLVVYHELAHAYMNTLLDRYMPPQGRLVEESLANALGAIMFHSNEQDFVQTAIKMQPPEYRMCRYWTQLGFTNLTEVAWNWGRNKVPYDPLMTAIEFIDHSAFKSQFSNELYWSRVALRIIRKTVPKLDW
jgi:hypothetical protein